MKHSKIVGTGSFGMVKKMSWFNDLTKKFVALKIMKVHLTNNMILARKELELKEETDLLQRFSSTDPENPFPQYFDCFYEKKINGPLYIIIVQEYLFSNMNNTITQNLFKQLSLKQRIKRYKELFEALRIMKRKEIVHSDIKPENIMANSRNFDFLKIIDFGCSGKVNKIYKGFTPSYGSPQKINNWENQLNYYEDDIYALGLSIIVIEVGSSIFKGIDKSCFFIEYNKKCHIQLKNQSYELLSKRIINSSFINILMTSISYKRSLRENADYYITSLKDLYKKK